MSQRIHLNSATAAALHQIADVFWFDGRSNECIDIVMIQFLQLQTQINKSYVFTTVRKWTIKTDYICNR